jgi:preprotein translocase subunit SecD
MSAALFLPLALLAMAPQDPPCPPAPAAANDLASDDPRLAEAGGPGLWVGGMPVASTEIVSARVTEVVGDHWAVDLTLSSQAEDRLAWLTGCRLGQPIEISVDSKLITRPIVSETVRGGRVSIAGGMDKETATRIARSLSPR